MAFFPYHDVLTSINDNIKKSEIICDSDKLNIYFCYDGVALDILASRKEKKNNIKRSLYMFLSNATKKVLPWGALTGIRPINIVTSIIEEKKFEDFYKEPYNINNSKESIKKYLSDEYYISNEKSDLIIDIANNELEILSRDKNENYKERYSIYVGVPFCKSTCLYCSFTSFDINKHKAMVSKYLDALEYEFNKEVNDANGNGIKLSNNNKFMPLSLYIGGGTPTSLNEDDFNRFLNIIDKYIETSDIEYTVEAGRPDTINDKKLKLMLQYGVNRISINPQTFNQETLDLIGRKHTVEDVVSKYNMARSLGFDNINMDIIVGLPNENINHVKKTLDYIINLKPDSLTIHSLALKRAARLNQEKTEWTENSKLAGLEETFNYKESEIYKMHELSMESANKMGMIPYYLYRQKNIAGNLENIGFSMKNKECVYNIMMMSERHSVFGFGCGGVTKLVKYDDNNGHIVKRIDGYKGLYDYVDRTLYKNIK